MRAGEGPCNHRAPLLTPFFFVKHFQHQKNFFARFAIYKFSTLFDTYRQHCKFCVGLSTNFSYQLFTLLASKHCGQHYAPHPFHYRLWIDVYTQQLFQQSVFNYQTNRERQILGNETFSLICVISHLTECIFHPGKSLRTDCFRMLERIITLSASSFG